ncbi:MAG: hypothetical protein J6W89_03425 [Paludibacteraceae bacterium]|nr:hypothetical protein [Paludibacteraceae bacterium]
MTTRYSYLVGSLLLVAFLPLHAAPTSPYTASVDSLLKVYDLMVSESESFVDRRQAAIDSLESLPNSAARDMQIAELYVPYRSDSALHYYNMAISAGDGDVTLLASIRRIRLLASVGNYAAAYRERENLGHIPAHLLLTYYDAMYRLYSEAAGVSRLQPYTDYYNAAANAYSDSLIAFCEQHNVRPMEYYRRCITRANSRRDFLAAMAYTDSAFARLTPDMHDYAIIAFERAVIYRETGDRQSYVRWLIRSAITDVRCGVTDNGSSWMVAEEVYNSGDLKRAYRYINYSVSNANIFNANPRYQQIAPLALIISRTYEDEQQVFNFRLWAAVFLLLAVIIAIVVAVIIAHRRNKELHILNAQLLQLNSQLGESNMVKEQYICRYLEVYSNMLDRMTRMARKTEKDPDAFLRKEMAVFYRDFDQTFIALYPTFINEFNALLRPDARITPKQGDILTTELRIFALIRLGIDASAKIAQLLRYAPNTIYNYRAQIRNAAVNGKEEFEHRVRLIGRHNL